MLLHKYPQQIRKYLLSFFFQAEDGIRVLSVTGVQTCALPILAFPFPSRLAQGGLRSLVMAPLPVESQVFGVLVVARVQAQGFSSGECEFLRQLSEHVALAAHQSQLYGALQQAYED